MENRFPSQTVAGFIGKMPLFRGVDAKELLKLVEASEQQHFESGERILPPGRPVAGLGILLRGKASLVLVDAASGMQTQVDQLGPGGIYGEVGLLLGAANPLSAVAEEGCDTLVVPKDRMERLLQGGSAICLALAQQVSTRFVKLSLLGGRGKGSEERREPALAAAERNLLAGGDDLKSGQIPWVDVGTYNITPQTIQMIPSDVIAKHRLLPLELKGKKLTVGLVNPRSVEAMQDLRRVLHTVDPEVVAISADDFSQVFARLNLDISKVKTRQASAERHVALTYQVEQEKEADKAKLYIGNEAISLLDKIIAEGLERGASDIHIEPQASGVKVRYRVQGGLVDQKEFIASSYAAPLVARIKILAELDTTERRQAQDGRIFAQLGQRELNLRVSTIPSARGEKAVLRLIDSADAMRPLHQIVQNPTLEKAMRTALAEPFGAIVVAGPTGGGKSSTLYSMLNERRLARQDTSIVTVEDPIEYLLPGVTQIPVLPKAGFGFSQALRGLMRQDPDVIMIGELRDSDTTTIMVEAALTGHLVLTSIHGNNAVAVIQRLQHLGTNPILLSQALSLIVVQRLVKRLCPNCVTESDVAPAMLESLIERKILSPSAAIRLPRPVGCDACGKTGYLGRVAVQEIMSLDESIRTTLAANARPEELVEQAKTRNRYYSFAQAAAFLMARRLIAPGDALLVVAE
ncbi:MAG: ATPase, T2SS/T4P/T4SS family [Deltaproteobacteria bacterium]|nr:ATPase, T2SS/T4P/T4SS family [Deltaproteobacteria bacterium]